MFDKKRVRFKDTDAIIVTGLGEYDLCDTLECGQCFRYERVRRDDGIKEYLTVAMGVLIRVAQKERGELIFFDVTDEVFENIIVPYFALDLPLADITSWW